MKLRMDSAAAEESPVRQFIRNGTAIDGAIPPELQRILLRFIRCFRRSDRKNESCSHFYRRIRGDVKNMGRWKMREIAKINGGK